MLQNIVSDHWILLPGKFTHYSAGQKFRTFNAMNFLWPLWERGANKSLPISSREARKKFLFKCAKLLTKTVYETETTIRTLGHYSVSLYGFWVLKVCRDGFPLLQNWKYQTNYLQYRKPRAIHIYVTEENVYNCEWPLLKKVASNYPCPSITAAFSMDLAWNANHLQTWWMVQNLLQVVQDSYILISKLSVHIWSVHWHWLVNSESVTSLDFSHTLSILEFYLRMEIPF